MPRAKVDPESRRRALQACEPCKHSKKRCDSNVPCLNCVKKNDGVSCVYSSDRPRIPASLPHAGRRRTSRSKAEAETVEGNESRLADMSSARMLWTSSGSQVYLGDSASLSFLPILRNILAKYMGPSDFTDDASKSFMLETKRDAANPHSNWVCAHDEEAYTDLVDTYFAASSGILDVIDRAEVMHGLRADLRNTLEPARSRDGILHTILAIGALSRANGLEDQVCEKHHLAKAQEIAFENMLENLTIDTARLFTVLSLYMFGACRRNVGFMYIGVAARAASALGLHRQESYSYIEGREKTVRLKTWKSIRILDLLVCAILGRPPATTDTETTIQVSEAGVDEEHRTLALDATFEIWTIVDSIVQKLYHKAPGNLLVAKGFLERLESWSSKISPVLKTHEYVPGPKLRNQQVVLGNMHVACSYYYAVILATRKYLVAHLTSELAASSPNAERDTAQQLVLVPESAENSKLAQACIESALLMLKTCKEVLDADMLLRNMCVLKGWIFTAAIIVGFAMFARENPDPEMEETFSSGNAVLQKLGLCSPQAKRYFEILSNLHGAIKEYRRRQSSHQESEKKSFVTRIFSIGMPSPPEPQEAVPIIDSQMVNNLDTNNSGWTNSFGFDGYPGLSFDDTEMTFKNIDSVAVQLWDEFLLGQEMGFA